ncbi:MAG: hypothetical protein Q4A78_07200 [Peptostreptococcaceae bacterium]|nr:hypothetical protein [Peptostreptococcaceae bacterium]
MMVRRQGLGNFRHQPQYIGLTIEEARALSEKEANKENVRSELRQKVIKEALDEAEKNLQKFQAEKDKER